MMTLDPVMVEGDNGTGSVNFSAGVVRTQRRQNVTVAWFW